jgi:hypothetical protein
MKEELSDRVSAGVKRALDTLFVANPTGTSLGILIGVVLHGILQFAAPLLSAVQSFRFSAIRMWHLCAAGVVGFNLRPYLRRTKINPQIEEALSFIDSEAKRLSMPRWQRNKMYENLFAKILADVVLNETTRNGIAAMHESISKKR